MRNIGQQFYQARIHKNLSQAALAKIAGLTQAAISKIEAGKDVQLSTLLTLAKALGLEIVAITSALFNARD